jgi:hypothetical protein
MAAGSSRDRRSIGDIALQHNKIRGETFLKKGLDMTGKAVILKEAGGPG